MASTTTHPSKDQRRELCSADVTLNGEPAVISGYSLPFAHVTQLRTGLSAEWAWATVALVVSRGGDFRS
jgi:uncharacterized membrane protein YjfL (UPF0719 family)